MRYPAMYETGSRAEQKASISYERGRQIKSIINRVLTPDKAEKPGYVVIQEVAQGFEADARHPAITGKIAEIRDQDNNTKYHSDHLPLEQVEVICAMGETETGIQILEDTVYKYYRSILDKQKTGRVGFIDDDETRLANLSMIRLTELYEQGIYAPADMRKLVETVVEFVVNGEAICQDAPYVPDQFGLVYFWNAALENPATVDFAWRTTLDNCKEHIASGSPNKQAQRDKVIQISNPLFKAANLSHDFTSEQMDVLTSYAKVMRPAGFLSYDNLHPDVFIRMAGDIMSDPDVPQLFWLPNDVKRVFSAEGTGTRLFDLMQQHPDSVHTYFPLLYRGIIWSPEHEFMQLTDQMRSYKKEHPFMLSESDAFSCLTSWDLTKADAARFLDWYQFVGPDLTYHLSSEYFRNREMAPEVLESMSVMYEKYLLRNSNGEARAAAVWIPINGERLFQTFADKGEAISFSGNLILTVESRAAVMRVNQPLKDVLAEIHRHLHYSQVSDAAVYMRGLYEVIEGTSEDFRGITREDIDKLMTDPTVKANMDMIRNQVCPELNRDKYENHLKMAINHVRSMESKKAEYGKDGLAQLLDALEQTLQQEITPQSIKQMSDMIAAHDSHHKGYVFPIVLALREYVLDNGIQPEGISQDDWLQCGINLAEFTGEISQLYKLMWRKVSPKYRDRALTLLMQGLREDYAHVTSAKASFEFANPHHELEAADGYRQITSRSLIDLLYRSAEQELMGGNA